MSAINEKDQKAEVELDIVMQNEVIPYLIKLKKVPHKHFLMIAIKGTQWDFVWSTNKTLAKTIPNFLEYFTKNNKNGIVYSIKLAKNIYVGTLARQK